MPSHYRDRSRFTDSLEVLPSLGFTLALGIHKAFNLLQRHLIFLE